MGKKRCFEADFLKKCIKDAVPQSRLLQILFLLTIGGATYYERRVNYCPNIISCILPAFGGYGYRVRFAHSFAMPVKPLEFRDGRI